MERRFLSPALRSAPDVLIGPLVGVEAKMCNDLWSAVIDGKIAPGAKVEEHLLCGMYGVSRTVTRKVLAILDREGIVSLPRNRGAYVAEPTRETAEQLLETVELLFGHFAVKLADNLESLSKCYSERLEEHLAADADARVQHDFRVQRRLRRELGILLGYLTDNRILMASLDRNSARLALAVSSFQDAAPAEAATFCADLIGHILGGNALAAAATVRTYFHELARTLQFPTAVEADLKIILGGAAT